MSVGVVVMDRRLWLGLCLAVILLLGCVAAQPVPTPVPMPTGAPSPAGKIPLHLSITDGVYPIDATIVIYWPDTDGEFTIGPTDHIVLPMPGDGAAFDLSVSAEGYQTWATTLVLTEALYLPVTLVRLPGD